jgi:hypothetical protein
MLPETHPLIEAITEPLSSNPECRLAVHTLLEENFDPEHPEVIPALRRIQKSKSNHGSIIQKTVSWSVAVIAVGLAVISYLPAIHFAEALSKLSFFEPWERPALPKDLTEQERLILGEPKVNPLEQKRRLYLSDSENPAYYAEYVNEWVKENKNLPDDYFETIERIDPDNAFFLYYAASVISKEAIEKKYIESERREPRIVEGVRLRNYRDAADEFSINDQSDFDRALLLIEKAVKLPKFKTYTNEMIVARVKIVPENTFVEWATSMIQVAYTPTLYMNLIQVSVLFSARAAELSKSNRAEDFLKLANQYDAFMRGLANNPDVSFVNVLVYEVIAHGTTANFCAAAEQLRLADLAEKYRKQRDAIRERKDEHEIRDKKAMDIPASIKSFSAIHDSNVRLISRKVSDQPKISDSELKPMRLVEHDLAGGVGVLVAALLLFPSVLIVFLYLLIVSRPLRLAAQSMVRMIGPKDWLLAIGYGIALPIFLFLVISRYSPLSGRTWGISQGLFAYPSVHLLALFFSLLIAPCYLLRVRLTKRLAPFRMKERFEKLPFYVIVALLLWAIFAFPASKFLDASPYLIVAGPAVISLCFLLFDGLRVFFEKSSTHLTRIASVSAALAIYPIVIAILCLLIPIYQNSERHWMAKETLLKINPDVQDLGAYEYKVAAQLRKEINAILGYN